jgi:hypothetical protein
MNEQDVDPINLVQEYSRVESWARQLRYRETELQGQQPPHANLNADGPSAFREAVSALIPHIKNSVTEPTDRVCKEALQLVKTLACVSYRFGGDAIVQTLIDGGLVRTLLCEMPKHGFEYANNLLVVVELLCSGSVSSCTRVRFTASVTQAVALEVCSSAAYNEVLQSALFRGHHLADTMENFNAHVSKFVKKDVGRTGHEFMTALELLGQYLREHPDVLATPMSNSDTEIMHERRLIVERACGACNRAYKLLYNETEDSDTASSEWVAGVTRMCVLATTAFVLLINRIPIAVCAENIANMLELAGWEVLQHIFAEVSINMMIQLVQTLVRVRTTDKSSRTVEQMFAFVAASIDKLQRRRVYWRIMHTSLTRTDGVTAVQLPNETDDFDAQACANAMIDPLGSVCAMIGLAPGDDDAQQETFVRCCLEYLKVATVKDSLDPVIDGTICQALEQLINEEREGTRQSVRLSLLNNGVLLIMTDIISNNAANSYAQPQFQALSTLFSHLVDWSFYTPDTLSVRAEVKQESVPQTSALMHILSTLTDDVTDTITHHGAVGAQSMFAAGVLCVLYTLIDLILRPDAQHSLQPGAIAIAHNVLALPGMVTLTVLFSTPGVYVHMSHEVQTLKSCALALCLSAVTNYKDSDDEIIDINEISFHMLHGVSSVDLVVRAMQRYSHICLVPTLICSTWMEYLESLDDDPAKAFMLELFKHNIFEALRPTMLTFPEQDSYVTYCVAGFWGAIFCTKDRFHGDVQIPLPDEDVIYEYVMLRFGHPDYRSPTYLTLNLVSRMHTPKMLVKMVDNGFISRALDFLATTRTDDADVWISETAHVLQLCCVHAPECVQKLLDLQGFQVMRACLKKFSTVNTLATTLSECMLRCFTSGGQTAVAQLLAQTDSLQLALVLMRDFPDDLEMFNNSLQTFMHACKVREIRHALAIGGIMLELIEGMTRFHRKNDELYQRWFACVDVLIKDDETLALDFFLKGGDRFVVGVLRDLLGNVHRCERSYNTPDHVNHPRFDYIRIALKGLGMFAAPAAQCFYTCLRATRRHTNAHELLCQAMCTITDFLLDCAAKVPPATRVQFMYVIYKACVTDEVKCAKLHDAGVYQALLERTSDDVAHSELGQSGVRSLRNLFEDGVVCDDDLECSIDSFVLGGV